MKYLKSLKFWIISVLVIYSFMGFIFIPWFLTNKTSNLLKEKIGINIEIGKSKFNPYTFELEVNDVLLNDLENKPVLGFKQISVDYTPIWLLEGTFLFKSLNIDSPKFYATLKKDGKLNLENIFVQSKQQSEIKKETSTKLPTITLQKLNITNGNIVFKDLRPQKEFKVDLGPYNFQAHDISAKRDALNAHNFLTKINKYGELFWEGGVRLNPLKLYGEINIKNLELPSYYKYALNDVDATLSNGILDLKIPYKIDLSNSFKLNIDGAKVDISNLSIKNKKTKKTITKVSKLNIDGLNLQWPKQKLEINKLNIDNPYVFTKLNENKELSLVKAFSSDIKKDNNKTIKNTKSKEWFFLLKNTYLNNANIVFIDNMNKKPIKSELLQTSLHVKNISLDKNLPIEFILNSKLNKATKITSSGKVISQPLKIDSNLQINNFDILEYESYIKPYINFQIKNTKIDIDTHINATMKEKLNINSLSNLIVRNLLFKTNQNQKFLEWKQLNISNIDFLWPQQKLQIEKLNLDKLYVSASLDKNKELSLIKIFEPKNQKKPSNKSQSDSKPWNFLLKEANLNDAKINFIDKIGTDQIATNLTKMSLHVKNISLDNKTPINYKINTKLNQSSVLKSSGFIYTKPLKLSSDIVLKDFNGANYTAYITPYLNFDINKVTIDTKTKLKITDKNKFNIKLSSDIKVKNLALKTNDKQKLLEWKNLNINKIKYNHNPMELSIKSLQLDDPFIKLHIDENGKTNFSHLIKKGKEKKKNSKKESKKQPIKMKIGPMKLVNGTSYFSDFSLPFPFATHIHDLNGDFSTLDFQTTMPSLLNLEGKIDKYGYTHITGKLSPFNIKENANLDVLFKNIDLSSLTPYSGKFVGYKIKKGKLSMDLKYNIEKSKLVGDNKLNIDTLILGGTIKSKDAINLPLELAIALLKDSNDQIDINMPVSGNMDNPKFSYGSVIWGAFGNMITGIVTAPFKFLGSMLGVDGDKLKSIDFDKGTHKIISTEHEKLENLEKILSKRPGIKLTIIGAYDETFDVLAIQEKKLNDIIKNELKNIKDAKKLAKIDIYGQVLEKLYTNKFTAQAYEKKKKNMLVDKKGKKIKLDIVAFNAILQNELSKEIKVSKKELVSLANKRAENIKDVLVNEYKIDKKRVTINTPKVTKSKRERWIQSELKIAI